MIGLFLCVVLYVTDGDTLRCQDGTRVRLAGIDAPELPGHCATWRRCTAGDPFKAKANLGRLAMGHTARCEAVGRSYERILAFCTIGGTDLACAQLRGSYAVRRYSFGPAVCRKQVP
jgi:endonuclease YncB( thermonuclease family)